MRVGACQTREVLADVGTAVSVIRDFSERADEADIDLLLFPECFLQGYLVTREHVHARAFEVASSAFAAILARLASIRQTVVLGMIERHRGRYYNTALVITGGRVVGGYRKRFLTGGESVFTAGDAYPVFDCCGVRFGINICSDTGFRQAAAARGLLYGCDLVGQHGHLAVALNVGQADSFGEQAAREQGCAPAEKHRRDT